MTRSVWAALSAILAFLLALEYQVHLKPILYYWGVGRAIQEVGNNACITVPELQACEKMVLHQPTGIVYLACSTPSSRIHWTPALTRLNASGRSTTDYVGTYNPQTSAITRFTLSHFPTSDRDSRSGPLLSVHGMDVVPSSKDPKELWVYVVNHRVPLGDGDPRVVGADSSVEVFKTRVGSSVLRHVRTYDDPTVIITPNDVVGAPDGKSFYFTNDHGEKTGMMRWLDVLGRSSTSIGFCHEDRGCKMAISHMHGNNGIVAAPNGTFYVADSLGGPIRVLERQSDDSLVITDLIPVDRPTDNLSIDKDGVLWAAGFSDVFRLHFKHFGDPTVGVASSALRISRNEGREAFFGDKYKVEKAFEDSGKMASGITSVVRDSARRRLFLHGLSSPHLVVCAL